MPSSCPHGRMGRCRGCRGTPTVVSMPLLVAICLIEIAIFVALLIR